MYIQVQQPLAVLSIPNSPFYIFSFYNHRTIYTSLFFFLILLQTMKRYIKKTIYIDIFLFMFLFLVPFSFSFLILLLVLKKKNCLLQYRLFFFFFRLFQIKVLFVYFLEWKQKKHFCFLSVMK